MMTEMLLNNVLAWAEQAFVIVSLGALLPLIFRIRHPRSQLADCHLLLAVCMLLPFVQPWQHPVVVVGNAGNLGTHPDLRSPDAPGASPNSPHSVPPSLPWSFILVGALLVGTAARLSWLGFGLWQIRKYRIAARPLHPLPPSILAARAIV